MASIDRDPPDDRERAKSNSCFSREWVLAFPCLPLQSSARRSGMVGLLPLIEGRKKKINQADAIPHKPT